MSALFWTFGCEASIINQFKPYEKKTLPKQALIFVLTYC